MRISILMALITVGCGSEDELSSDIKAVDQDCTWYQDADGDGFASPYESVEGVCGDAARAS